jgi:drug/metabolite transporter (DMT)-like permease
MNALTELDLARAAALKRIDRAERSYKLGIVFVGVFEGIFGLAFLALMDFHDRLHWLLLVAACLVYGIVIICVVNLGRYVNSATHTIVNAIFAQAQSLPSEGRKTSL